MTTRCTESFGKSHSEKKTKQDSHGEYRKMQDRFNHRGRAGILWRILMEKGSLVASNIFSSCACRHDVCTVTILFFRPLAISFEI